jgi:hypothetical protein
MRDGDLMLTVEQANEIIGHWPYVWTRHGDMSLTLSDGTVFTGYSGDSTYGALDGRPVDISDLALHCGAVADTGRSYCADYDRLYRPPTI